MLLPRPTLLVLLCFAFHAVFPLSVLAHQYIDRQIKDVNALIRSNPGQVINYKRRMSLLVEHRKFSQALEDLNIIEKLEPEYPDLDYLRAWVYWNQAIDPDSNGVLPLNKARDHLSALLKRNPQDYRGHHLKARVLVKQNRRSEAIEHYKRAAMLHPDPGTDLFFEQANNLYQLDRYEDANHAIALANQHIRLDKTILDLAIMQARKHKNYDQAIRWIDLMPEETAQLPSTLIDRAQLLLLANHKKEAVNAFCTAQKKLLELPKNVREAPRNSQLLNAIRLSGVDCK